MIHDTPHRTHQILTKRPVHLRRVADSLDRPSNLWIGASLEDTR